MTPSTGQDATARGAGRRSSQVVAAVLTAAALGFALWQFAVLVRHGRAVEYAMPWWVLVVAGLCFALIAAGGFLTVQRGQLLPWLTVLTTLVLCFAFLEIGTLALPVAVAVIVLRLRVGSRRVPRPGAWRPPAGPSLAVGVTVLASLALIGGPVVTCMPDGVSSAPAIWVTWFGPSSGSGSASGSASTTQSNASGSDRRGEVTVGATTYAYACAGDQLVQFSSR